MNQSERIEVPHILNDTQVRFFVENGYLIVPDLVSPDKIEALNRETIHIARGGYPSEFLKPLPPTFGDQDVLESLLCIHLPLHFSPVVLDHIKHPGICGVLSQVAGAHLAHWDGSVKCMQSMLFVKPPGFQGQAWHQDELYIPTRDRSLIGAWTAIDDATVDNGCLWVIPGSHKNGYLYPQRIHDNPDEFDFAPESYGFDESLEIPVEVKSGSVVFFNGHLLHRSKKNRSTIYRRSLVNHYMNAWSTLPWNLKEGENPNGTDRRAIVPVAGIDPYAWKGYETGGQDVWLRTSKAVDEKRRKLGEKLS